MLLQIIVSSAEEHSPVKPSAIIAANVDLDSLAADDLEYNYDVAGLAGEGAPCGLLLQCWAPQSMHAERTVVDCTLSMVGLWTCHDPQEMHLCRLC